MLKVIGVILLIYLISLAISGLAMIACCTIPRIVRQVGKPPRPVVLAMFIPVFNVVMALLIIAMILVLIPAFVTGSFKSQAKPIKDDKEPGTLLSA